MTVRWHLLCRRKKSLEEKTNSNKNVTSGKATDVLRPLRLMKVLCCSLHVYPLQNCIHSWDDKLVELDFRHSVHFHFRYRSYLRVVICAVNFQLYPLRRCKLRNLSWVYSAVSHSLKAFTGRKKLLKVAPNVLLSCLFK